MWASASRDTSNESQALMNDALYIHLLRFEKEHHSATWLRNHHARTPGTFGHFSGVSFHESKAQKGPVFTEKSSKEWFGSDRQSICFLKPLRCSTAISACATADLWKQSLQLFYVELIRLRPETWQKSTSPFGWGVNSIKLDLFFLLLQVSSTSQSCTESSGNSAFKFFMRQVSLSCMLSKGHHRLQFSYQWLQPQPAMAGWNLHISSATNSWLTDVSTPHRKLQRCSWPCHWDFWGETMMLEQ